MIPTIHDPTAECRDNNASSLIKLMAKYSLTINNKDYDQWRPTLPLTGDLIGLFEDVQILATNGIVAYFLIPGGAIFYAHTKNFTGKIFPLHSITKRVAPEKKTSPKGGKKPRTVSRFSNPAELLKSLGL